MQNRRREKVHDEEREGRLSASGGPGQQLGQRVHLHAGLDLLDILDLLRVATGEFVIKCL
jgi:hypothetical protein